jgi:hypothetical protein
MAHLRTIIFIPLVFFLLAGVQLTEKICEDRTGSSVANTPLWKPVNGPLNKSACMKGAEMLFEPVLYRIHG